MLNVVEFRNVSKSYRTLGALSVGAKGFLLDLRQHLHTVNKRVDVLSNITFSIPKNQSLGVIGRNGAGKSTLLMLMSGVVRADSGYLGVNGKVLPLLELGAGLHPDLSGMENIRLNGILLGMSPREVEAKKEEIIAFAELEDHILKPFRTYSSGMKARLGFSIAVHSHGDLLLIDEVLAVGDIAFKKKCERKIDELRRLGKTMVLVSHNLRDITAHCDVAIWLEKGTIREFGDATKVVREYEARAA